MLTNCELQLLYVCWISVCAKCPNSHQGRVSVPIKPDSGDQVKELSGLLGPSAYCDYDQHGYPWPFPELTLEEKTKLISHRLQKASFI